MARPANFRSQSPLREMDPFDGVLLVDKPAGPTSHDVVARIRKHFGIRKVGHGGTLDPQATGLLVILLQRGTKLSERLMGTDKVYEGVIHLGIATDSQDADGNVVSESDASHVTREMLEAEIAKLRGDVYQVPPMVSAVKVEGVPLYKRARKGQTVEREPKLVHVYEFRVATFEAPRAAFVVKCSKGTYVRTLCADVGEALGCGAHLAALRRTVSGDLSVEDALPLDALLRLSRDELMDRVLPVTRFMRPRIR